MNDEARGRVLPGVSVPPSVTIAYCRSCGKPIWWGRTRADKNCPFDVAQNGQPTMVTHFSTCPQARRWSKR